jgi:hypothetical protein
MFDIVSGLVDTAIGWSRDNYLRGKQYDREDTRIRRTVADAKAAGLHPLYALGAGVTGSGGHIVGETPYIARQASEGATAKKIANAQLREANARARLANAEADEIETAAVASKIALAKQAANAKQDGLSKKEFEKEKFKTPFGNDWYTKDSAPTQHVEDHYGDPVGWGYGLMKLAEDFIHTIEKKREKKFQDMRNKPSNVYHGKIIRD